MHIQRHYCVDGFHLLKLGHKYLKLTVNSECFLEKIGPLVGL
jgi:hypothetical protein